MKSCEAIILHEQYKVCSMYTRGVFIQIGLIIIYVEFIWIVKSSEAIILQEQYKVCLMYTGDVFTSMVGYLIHGFLMFLNLHFSCMLIQVKDFTFIFYLCTSKLTRNEKKLCYCRMFLICCT